MNTPNDSLGSGHLGTRTGLAAGITCAVFGFAAGHCTGEYTNQIRQEELHFEPEKLTSDLLAQLDQEGSSKDLYWLQIGLESIFSSGIEMPYPSPEGGQVSKYLVMRVAELAEQGDRVAQALLDDYVENECSFPGALGDIDQVFQLQRWQLGQVSELMNSLLIDEYECGADHDHGSTSWHNCMTDSRTRLDSSLGNVVTLRGSDDIKGQLSQQCAADLRAKYSKEAEYRLSRNRGQR
jgi:hypothetical protein